MGHFNGKIGTAYEVPSKSGPKMAVFRELRAVNVKFVFSNPEMAHPCAKPRPLVASPSASGIQGSRTRSPVPGWSRACVPHRRLPSTV